MGGQAVILATAIVSAMPEPGRTIGGYSLDETLGEGAMGEVFRARSGSGEVVAVKLLRSDLARDQGLARRFHREFRAAAQVSHPHLVPVIDQGEHEGLPYIVQTFMGGGSLAERIASGGRLGIEETVRISEQLAGGLDALHDNGLVHRDLKPGNVLFDEEGVAHVADLGLVKDRTTGTVITRPGHAVGTMDYMSPEQVRGEEVDRTSDVYSLGCLVFTCLAGHPPFADQSGMQIMWAHLRGEPGDACAERGDAPEGFGDAVNLALAKKPADRPDSARLYARMLRLALKTGS